MIQGINSDYDSYYSITALTGSTVAATSDSTNEKTAQGGQSTRTDTVEISPQARAAMQQANTVVSVGGKASSQNSSNQQSANTGAMQAAAAQANTAVVVSASSSSQQPVLTNLTEAELDDLASKGTITQAQEQTELARRATAEQQSQGDAVTQKAQTARISDSYVQHAIETYNSQGRNTGSGITSENLMNRVA